MSCKVAIHRIYLWGTKNHKKWNRIEKVMAPQSRGGQKLKKKTIECYKGQFANT
jgi:hypothetical protein